MAFRVAPQARDLRALGTLFKTHPRHSPTYFTLYLIGCEIDAMTLSTEKYPILVNHHVESSRPA